MTEGICGGDHLKVHSQGPTYADVTELPPVVRLGIRRRPVCHRRDDVWHLGVPGAALTYN
ncbi:hypothetical protein OHA70_31940 [Kribbella sp. NBC_00382]|uniref:hypothetical protein n=1 Tax=Kribbella sp. NBC_00382 TaxID=2975967 RepID=UPI002E2016C3